jgi:hypothetical protein
MAPIPIDIPALVRSLCSILPELIVIAAAIAVLLADLFLPEGRKRILCGIGIAGVAAAIGAALWLGPGKIEGFSGMIAHDGMGLFATLTILGVVLLTLLMATGYAEWEGTQKGEFYALLLLSTAGMLIMAKGTDLMTVFLGLETMSIPIYCLVGFHRNRMTSLEGALKYFLLGAFASGFLLYGIALMYFVTGTTQIAPLAAMARDLRLSGNPVFLAGMGLLLVGFGFKVSLAPFHMWTPDAYEGAPTLVTAFMGAAVKAAAFAALIRVALLAFPAISPAVTDILWVLAVLTMTVGNLSALLQDNVKRMLAYSSIAHAGYILVGLVAGGVAGLHEPGGVRRDHAGGPAGRRRVRHPQLRRDRLPLPRSRRPPFAFPGIARRDPAHGWVRGQVLPVQRRGQERLRRTRRPRGAEQRRVGLLLPAVGGLHVHDADGGRDPGPPPPAHGVLPGPLRFRGGGARAGRGAPGPARIRGTVHPLAADVRP